MPVDTPQRPDSHRLETEARQKIEEVFHEHGWIVDPITHDYGEDMLARAFSGSSATPYAVLIQAKGASQLQYRPSRDYFAKSVKTRSVRLWIRMLHPVVLVAYERTTRSIYWQAIHKVVGLDDERLKTQDTLTIPIPRANRLDADGMMRVLGIARRHYRRAQLRMEAAEALQQFIVQETDFEIDEVSPDNEVLVVSWPENEGGGKTILVFGDLRDRIEALAESEGVSFGEMLKLMLLRRKEESVRMARRMQIGEEVTLPSPDVDYQSGLLVREEYGLFEE